jgi:uncharacterized membrane protein YhaH (DUF805 family)
MLALLSSFSETLFRRVGCLRRASFWFFWSCWLLSFSLISICKGIRFHLFWASTKHELSSSDFEYKGRNRTIRPKCYFLSSSSTCPPRLLTCLWFHESSLTIAWSRQEPRFLVYVPQLLNWLMPSPLRCLPSPFPQRPPTSLSLLRHTS